MQQRLSEEEKTFVRILLERPNKAITFKEQDRVFMDQNKQVFRDLRRAGYLEHVRDDSTIHLLYLTPTKECIGLL